MRIRRQRAERREVRSKIFGLRTFDASLLALLFLAPLCMGGRHPVGRLLFIAMIGLVGISWLWQRCLVARGTWRRSGAEWLIVASFSLLVFQLVPLPETLLTRVSPAVQSHLPIWSDSAATAVDLGRWTRVSLHPRETWNGLLLFASYALLFVTLIQRLDRLADVERMVRWVALAIVSMALFGLVQRVTSNGAFLWVYDHPSRDTYGVVHGAFANQNHFAHYIALGIAPLIWWVHRRWVQSMNPSRHCESLGAKKPSGNHLPQHVLLSKGGLQGFRKHVASYFRTVPVARGDMARIVLAVALGFVIVAGLLTLSRAGVIAVGLAILASISLLLWTNALGRRAWCSLLLMLALVGVSLAGHGYKPLTTQLATFVGARSLADMSVGRDQIWTAVRKAIGDFPIVGTGVGTHADVYPIYMREYSPVQFSHAESGYLQVFEETGIVGLGLLVLGIGMATVWCYRSLTRARSQRVRILAGVVATSLLISVLHSFVDFVWYIPACMSVTVVLLACARRLDQIVADEQASEQAASVTAASVTVIDLSGTSQVPQWIAAVVVTLLVVWGVADSIAPARAARHWDQFLRVSADTNEQPLTNPGDQSSGAQHRGIQRERARIELHLSEMESCLSHAVAANPEDAKAHCRLAATLLQQFELAQRHAENRMSLAQVRDAALASNFPSLKVQQQWLSRAIGENRHLLQRALTHSRRAIELSPLQGESYVYLAQLGFLAGGGRSAKDACLRQALLVRPHKADVLMAVGSEMVLDGQLDRAVECWERVFDRAPKYQQQITQLLAPRVPATFFLESMRPDEQGAKYLYCYYQKIGMESQAQTAGRYYLGQLDRQLNAEEMPLDGDQWFQAFLVQQFLGDSNSAITCLRNAVKAESDNYAVRRRLARELIQQNQFAEANEHLRWCLRRKPDDEQLQREFRVATQNRLQSETMLR